MQDSQMRPKDYPYESWEAVAYDATIPDVAKSSSLKQSPRSRERLLADASTDVAKNIVKKLYRPKRPRPRVPLGGQEAGTYTEVSPSGDGLHLIFRGAKPEGAERSRRGQPCRRVVEMYDHDRYFTVTGMVFEGRGEREPRRGRAGVPHPNRAGGALGATPPSSTPSSSHRCATRWVLSRAGTRRRTTSRCSPLRTRSPSSTCSRRVAAGRAAWTPRMRWRCGRSATRRGPRAATPTSRLYSSLPNGSWATASTSTTAARTTAWSVGALSKTRPVRRATSGTCSRACSTGRRPFAAWRRRAARLRFWPPPHQAEAVPQRGARLLRCIDNEALEAFLERTVTDATAAVITSQGGGHIETGLETAVQAGEGEGSWQASQRHNGNEERNLPARGRTRARGAFAAGRLRR